MSSVDWKKLVQTTRWLIVTLMLVTTTCVGCGSKGPVADKVNPDVAIQTLTNVLDSWRASEPIETCQQWTPQVVAQEILWTEGSTLLDYKIGSSTALDANLFVEVELKVRAADGTTSEKNVTYCVGTDPVLTVFRAYM